MKQDEKKLRLWQERLTAAENAIEGERARMQKREKLYEGDHTIYGTGGRAQADGEGGISEATHVRNVCFEMVETQVDSTIPSPKVTAVRPEDEELADIVENLLRDVLDRLPMERINDEGERISPVQGGHGLLVDWLDSVSGRDWLGDLRVQLVHPRCIVPQAGVYQVADMDWVFLKTPQTKRQIRVNYGVELEDENESDPETRRLGEGPDTTDEIVTMVTAYYRNKTGGVGRLRWVNDTVLEDLDDYQVRRVHRCRACGAVGDGRKCSYCGGVKFETVTEEYEELTDELAKYSDSFEKIAIGDPLLTSDADFEAVMTAITDATKDAADGKTAICFMGHGTTADSNSVYSKMQTLLTDKGFNDYYVGTVEATPSLDDVLAAVQKGNYEKVILRPLMIVAGDHANNDMAGDEDDSWKSTFEKAGYTVDCQVEGLGQLEAIQQLFVEHAKAAVASAEAE